MTSKFSAFFRNNYILIGLLFLFSLLLFRNPYSNRTLIPNLEPFPDTMYYTTPPRCFIMQFDWKMCRLQKPELPGIPQVVPPAYSIVLLPAYLLNFDVRSFYFVNILLSFLSFILLYKIANRFFGNKFISGFISLVYITTYAVYWYPTLAMAENLMQPLFLLSIYLLQNKTISIKTSFLAGILAATFYATKYAYAPLTAVFPLIFTLKVWSEYTNKKIFFKHILVAAIPGSILLFNLTDFLKLFGVVNSISNGALDSGSSSTTSSGAGDFSSTYFVSHVKDYFGSIFGNSHRFLWDGTPLLEKWIAIPANFGLLISLKSAKFVYAKIWLIAAILSQILFMSTFYFFDVRYVFHLLPALLLGFGFFLEHLRKTIFNDKTLFYSFLAMLCLVYLATNAIRLKTVIMVNIKYSETPWWYLSQIEVDAYFEEHKNELNDPYLISLYAPFLLDNFTKQNFTPLPLDAQQDFKGSFKKVWGEDDYTDLIALYTRKLENNSDVFLTNYGVTAADFFQKSYATITESFNSTLVHTGCYNLCNIYKLELKK